MITTVVTAATVITVTTVATVTTVTTIIAMGLAATVGTVAIAGFGVLLGTKELASAVHSAPGNRLSRFLSVGIWPLDIAFGVFMTMKTIGVTA